MKKLLPLLLLSVNLGASVVDDLRAHEGYRSSAYLDTTGHYTVGFGRRCVQGAQMSREQAALALNGDIATAERGARKLWPSFANHSQQVQDALVEIVFQIGATGAAKFVRFGAAIAAHDYTRAGAELLASKWAKQTPNRVRFLVGKLTP